MRAFVAKFDILYYNISCSQLFVSFYGKEKRYEKIISPSRGSDVHLSLIHI